MPSLMDFDTHYREKFSSHIPLFFPDNYSKPREEFSLEGPFSSKGTSFVQDLHPLENFNLNGPSSSSNPMFSLQPTTCFDTNFDNSVFGCLPSYDYYETKPFGNHAGNNNGGLMPLVDLNYNQGEGGGGMLGHSQMMVTPINMISPNAQSHNSFSYREFSLAKYKPPDEGSCTTKTDVTLGAKGLSTTTNVVKKGGRGRKKKTNVVKGQWTIEEDRLLIQLVERYGVRKWSQIAQLLSGRIGKQCRERWHNHLRPDIKKDVWSEEEDKILITAHAEIGNKWAEIAKKLPGRTENSIKNHWNATKRRQFSRRKCRSKYPRQSSLLQDYIKSLTPETINAGCRKKPPSSSNPSMEDNANKVSNDQAVGSSDSSSSDRLGHEYDYSYEVPDFNFDAQMFEESSIDSLLDYSVQNNEDVNGTTVGYDDHHYQGTCSSEILNDAQVDINTMLQCCEVKKEIDLVEMINQVNI